MADHQRRSPRRPGLPLYARLADPEILYKRAKELGEAAADAPNGLGDTTIGEVIGALIEAAKLRGFVGNADDLRIRLSWATRDARDARERGKRDVERHLQLVAIRAIVAGLSLEATLEAARRANRDCDPPLLDGEVAVLVQTEIAIERRRQECPCCSRAEARHGR